MSDEERKNKIVAALIALDGETLRTMVPMPPPELQSVLGEPDMLHTMHMLRYEAGGLIDDELRMQSYHWLRERGHGRMGMRDLLPEGELPPGIKHGIV